MYYPGHSVRLLVVDEHLAYADLVENAASVWGELVDIQCEFVSTAVEALERLSSFQPNVIMLDAHLSDMNCLDFLDLCRDGLAPLIITSQHPSSSLCDSVLSHGASAFVPKTDDPDEIEVVLEKIIRIAVEGPLTH